MSWLQTIAAWWRGSPGYLSEIRQVSPAPVEVRPDVPTVSSGGAPGRLHVGPGYSVEASMTAFAAFPLVFACISAIAGDLAGLALRIRREGAPDAPPSDPVLRLLYRPTVRGSGVLLRAQLVCDLRLTGTCYARIIGAGGPVSAMSVVRLHPSDCTIVPWADGQPGNVEYRPPGTGQVIRLTPGVDVVVVRLPSWRPAEQAVYGTGGIEALRKPLSLSAGASARAAESISRGKPALLGSPAASSSAASAYGLADLTPEQREQIQADVAKAFDAAHDGVAIVGRSMTFSPIGWGPRDLATLEIDERTAVLTMSALGVPAVRLGYPIANAPTPRDAMGVYWQGLQALAALIDDVWSNWIDSLPGYGGAWMEHDFRAVRSLQFAQDGAIQRAQSLVAMGMRPEVALSLMGIDVPPGAWGPTPGEQPEDPDRRPSEGPGMDEPPADQTRPQGPQRGADALAATDLEALARLLAQETHHGQS